jgi:hypothetical protein
MAAAIFGKLLVGVPIMAIPIFGFLKIEALACLLMVVAGVIGLFVALSGGPHVSTLWLVLQSLAVIAGGIGAWHSYSFVLAAIGTASSLVKVTPVGRITVLPGILMLLLLLMRRRAFNIFLPRWRGPGPPPPGAWKR